MRPKTPAIVRPRADLMPRWFRAGGLVRQRFLQMAAPSGRIFANPITAHSCPIKYDSIRPRTRFAVSGFAFQIGSSTRITRPVSIAYTGSGPIAGLAYVSKGPSTVCGAFRFAAVIGGSNVRLGSLAECQRFGAFKLALLFDFALRIDRVDALISQ